MSRPMSDDEIRKFRRLRGQLRLSTNDGLHYHGSIPNILTVLRNPEVSGIYLDIIDIPGKGKTFEIKIDDDGDWKPFRNHSYTALTEYLCQCGFASARKSVLKNAIELIMIERGWQI